MPDYWNGFGEINVLTPLPPEVITLNLQSLLWLVVPISYSHQTPISDPKDSVKLFYGVYD